ncbi:MAG: autoinducer 2 ABC transporter substrate-binding protein [Firmicutes bacterium]|nr:autoinducer 2 ABC transporter substrate-binding protein [Bacillota bacterium]
MKKYLSIMVFVLLLALVGSGIILAEEDYTILVMPKLVGIPYFNASEIGAIQAGKDLGVEVIYAGPTQADAAAQVKMIEDYISRGVDAIAVAPNDPAALTPLLKKAREEGILVLDWDTPADKDLVDYSIHQIDDQAYGEHIVDLLVEEMGTEKGDYAILTGGLSAANLNSWIDYGLKYAAEKYPGLNLVTERIPTDEKQQEALSKTLNLLRAYPSLKGIIGVSTPAPIGAAQAVEERGVEDEVAVVGTALPNDSRPYLKSGALRVATLWEPNKLGYLTVYVALEALKGNKIIDGMEVPKVGALEVWDDGKTIIMGPPTDFTAENVDKFNF